MLIDEYDGGGGGGRLCDTEFVWRMSQRCEVVTAKQAHER